jgi:hypothetical protein
MRKTHLDPLHIECIQDALCGLDHPVVIGRHPVTSFDSRSLVAVVAEKQLHWMSSESSEAEYEGPQSRILSRLCMGTVPFALLTLLEPSTE